MYIRVCLFFYAHGRGMQRRFIMRSDKEFKSKVMRAANKIHNAGGCDAADEYSRGYDDAISLALLIFMEETGFVIEDIVDYEEDEKI